MSWTSFVEPVMRHFRNKRLAMFAKSFPDIAEMSVLDVGGRPMLWKMLDAEFGVRPKKLVMLNTEEEVGLSEGFHATVGDGCDMEFADSAFDLVFSNSVIKHIGSFLNMKRFAEECKRVGKEVYIQTPNRWFPVEPHIIALFVRNYSAPLRKPI